MKFISAINSISPQVWAVIVLLIGCIAVGMFHRLGIDIGIAAGIIGTALNMFTGFNKAHQDPQQPEGPAQPK